jgi:hypothetical protein
MSYPWIKDSQYVPPIPTGYLAVTSPNGLYLTDGVSNTIITPTSVTSTIFNGNLNGTVTNATNATNVAIADDNTDATFYPVFVSNNTGNLPLKVDKTTNPLSYNPSTGTLIGQVFSPGSGNSTFSALSITGLEVLNATSGRTKILNNQITCATTATGIPPTTTINPDSITCSSLNLGSTTTITPTSVTAGSGSSTFSQLQNTGLQVVNAGSNTTTINSNQITCSQVSGSLTTIITPTSVTTTTFNGALNGNATTATNVTNGLGGQILYQSAVNTTAKLANGTAGQFLQSNGTTLAPSWINQNAAATVSLSPTSFSTSGTTTLTANFNSSYSSVTNYPVTLTNNNGGITISVNTYVLSGGVAGGQYTIVLAITMVPNAGTTLNFNGTGIASGAKFNFTSITNTYSGTTATKYVVLTFAYDGTNYFMSGSNFT